MICAHLEFRFAIGQWILCTFCFLFGTGVSIVIMLSLSHHFILEVWSGGTWLVSLVHIFFISRGSYTWRTTPFGNLSCMWPLFKWRDRLWADIIMGWNFEFLGARGECTLHIRRIGILWLQGQLWQILFSKDWYNNTSHPTCWLTVLLCYALSLRRGVCFLSLWIWVGPKTSLGIPSTVFP